jgi:hypothetical protein
MWRTCCWRLYLPTFNPNDLLCYLQDEVVFGVDQVSYYVEDLLLEARTGGSDEDAEALTDDDIELLRGFEYKVRTNIFFGAHYMLLIRH